MNEENQWTKHEIEFQHGDGQKTLMYMQTDGRRYVLSEHPENQGPHVSTAATKYGDEVAKNNLDVDHKNRPENVQLYAERRDGRFDQWEAKTTRDQNVSTEPNRFEYKASEWQWKNAKQFEHGELQQGLGTKLEQGHTKFQDKPAEEQNQAFREASMAKTGQSESARDVVNDQQQRQAAQQQAAQEQQREQRKHQR